MKEWDEEKEKQHALVITSSISHFHSTVNFCSNENFLYFETVVVKDSTAIFFVKMLGFYG